MSLVSRIEDFRDKKVIVFGDLVADVFVHGEIARVSREAPVMILSHRDTQTVPGGAANAVHNLWAMGARPIPIGVLGDDAAGDQLLEFFDSRGIETGGIELVRGYDTPTKTRILAGAAHAYRQQVLRIDRGAPVDPQKQKDIQRSLRRRLRPPLRAAAAVLVSDYGYGTVRSPLPREIRNRRGPVTLDSRFGLTDHTGLTAATPNEPEVEAALGYAIDEEIVRLETAGRTLLRRLKHDALLITRGRHGMTLFERRKKPMHLPIHGTDEVADVTGAGDTVIAVFTLALAAGGSFTEAALLSNYAGGIAVMKHGTQPVTADELLNTVMEEDLT